MSDSKKQQLLARYPQNADIVKRFSEYVGQNWPSMRQFCQTVGINQTQLSRVLRGDSIFSADMLLKISESNCDMNWLLRGEKSALDGWDKEKELLEFHISRLEQMIENLMKK